MLSLRPIRDFVMAPIFCITEAKKQDLEAGTVQGAAQPAGVHRLNELAHRPVLVLYGGSTTGVDWRFLTLVGQRPTLDYGVCSSCDLPQLRGTMQHMGQQTTAAQPVS